MTVIAIRERVGATAGPNAIVSFDGEGEYPATVVDPVSTRMVSKPASMPATTSVSIRSPTIMVLSEWASIRLSALRNIIGLGLPTK